MIVETLHFEAMLVVVTVLVIFFATIWSASGLANVCIKLFLIAVSLWTTANTIVYCGFLIEELSCLN